MIKTKFHFLPVLLALCVVATFADCSVAQMSASIRLGERVWQSAASTPQSEIDLSNQPAGVYYLHVQSALGTTMQKIVVSQ